jgi:hypothetical protein
VARATDNNGLQTLSSPAVIVATLPPLNLLQLGITNFECALCLSNTAGFLYDVLAATNPRGLWTNLGTMAGSNGYSYYFDPAFTNLPSRFYRAGPQTDLGYTSDTVWSASFTNGTATSVAITVGNSTCSGVSVAAGPFHLGFYLATNSGVAPPYASFRRFQENLVTNGCPANTAATTTWRTTLTNAPGSYYFGWQVDDLNEVPNCDTNRGSIWYRPVTLH